jgi:ParB family chromosome partitioning protein
MSVPFVRFGLPEGHGASSNAKAARAAPDSAAILFPVLHTALSVRSDARQISNEGSEESPIAANAANWAGPLERALAQTQRVQNDRERRYPDGEDGAFSDVAKAKGIALLTIDHQGELSRSYYTKSVQRSAKRDKTGTPLPRPLYDARMVEDLSQVRTAALQVEVATNQHVAYAVLLDALLPLVTSDGYAPAHALQLKAGSLQRPGSRFDISTREVASPFDGVADLIAAVPEDAGERFAWLLTLESRTVDELVAACVGSLIDATQGKHAEGMRMQSVDRIARAVGLDMREHWEGGIAFYDRLTRKTALAALEEAKGAPVAENCAKLKKPELAAACNDRIPGSGWLPPALLTPEVPLAVPASEAEEGEEEPPFDCDNDTVEMLIAAE